MNIPFHFKIKYFVAASILFGIEVLIALYAHDQIIRPYVGDMLVVVLIYCFVKSVVNTPVIKTAIAVLLFSYIVEILQYFNFITMLGLQHSAIARVILGTSFAWIDLLAYTVGISLVLIIEKIWTKKSAVESQP